MIGGGASVSKARHALPLESFAELAFELRLVARDKAWAAESCEQLVAAIEAGGEIDRDGRHIPRAQRRPLELMGMRDAVAELQTRARLAGRAAEALDALAPREDEIRALLDPAQRQPALIAQPRWSCRWLAPVLAFARRRAVGT